METLNRLIYAPLFWLALTFVALASLYMYATPIMEASDELSHIGMVEYVANEHNLPLQIPGDNTNWRQEGSQPPLYYILAAALIAPIGIDDLDDVRILNPHVASGQPDSDGNKNFIVHDDLHPHLADSVLAIYVLRLFGVALGVISLVAIYKTARLLAPERPAIALLAGGLLAFNPMFLFIAASVNNDNLVIALCSVITLLTLIMLQDGFNLQQSLWLSVLIALASLAKLSGLVMIPVVAATALWVAYRDKNWRGLVTLGALMIAFWAIIAGWWYVRNLQLYGELFGTTRMVEVAGERPGAFTLQTAFDEFEGFRWSFWGVFGLFNIVVPTQLFYSLLDILVVLSGVGLIIKIYRLWINNERQQLSRIILLALVIGIGFFAFLTWTAQTFASQGRLLFPYNVAILPLIALGIVTLTDTVIPRFRFASYAPIVFLGIAAMIIPFTVIMPEYAIDKPVEALPNDAIPVYARFGEVEMIGYKAEDKRYAPGDVVKVTIYWRVLSQYEDDNSLFLTFFDPDGDSIGKIDSYPGAGTLRTTTWRKDAIYADENRIQLSPNASGFFPLRMQVGWRNFETEQTIESFDENNAPLDAVILNIGGFADDPITVETMGFESVIDAPDFGGKIRLLSYQLSNDVLRVHWQAIGNLDRDYVVFAHVVDDHNNLIGQGDTSPDLPTRYWRPGDEFVTEHILAYPETPSAGDYQVTIGWYDPEDFTRLPVGLPDEAYPLTQIKFE